MQFNEYYHGRTGLTVGVKKVLFSESTPYQKVEVFETDTWGNMMTIDGMVMLSEKDEFVYHEMLVHVAMFSHPDPKRVLIIGGGDGGSAREVLRHPGVEQVDMVEIDEAVVRAARQFLPDVGDFDNPRLKVYYEDGITFVNNISDPYDVIIIDGSDPVGPAIDLFSDSFYKSCYRALGPDGVLTSQTESPWVASYHSGIRKLFHSLDSIFELSAMYLAFIPLYPSGMWSLAFASKGIHPHDPEVLDRVARGTTAMNSSLRYYNPDIHKGAFALPGFVKDILR
ncbi:polyamine aminopropyltransferase [Natronogracilivirga saccharolytica]|uniref:Polyamine aminopropyltransferase n=1 Tax=Natronogracilivirga saccharolytica TaxID=2812953 RepID=A0A8J7RNT8_9BACT|nr:polyamine aminopropyltransferase [Natronogracilivirga saccharolytica]MBP3193174.1 polyamine aminopropyltransferase [Natronogracilivirga saccharolytica]